MAEVWATLFPTLVVALLHRLVFARPEVWAIARIDEGPAVRVPGVHEHLAVREVEPQNLGQLADRQQEAHAPMFGLPPPRRADLQVLRGYTFTSCMPIGHHASADPSLRALEASFIVAILVVVEGEPPRQLARVRAALLPSLLPGRRASRYTITHLSPCTYTHTLFIID